MTPEIQKSILGACARFIRKSLEPLEKRIIDVETKSMQVPLDGIVKELLSAEELRTLVDLQVAEAVTKHFAENPVQKGEQGPAGEKGADGADGVGLAGAVINRDNELVITKTNGEAVTLGVVIGRDGKDGEKGQNGADFTNVEFDYDGERGLVIRGAAGEIVKRLPIPIDRGYWREGMKAEKSDVLTHDGSVWIALKDTSSKPCRENSEDWRLMVRKGRDGLQGNPGKDYKPAEPVKLNG